jgi:CDGSH-type Zn-finger protein/truncated hemoglobin YjbI
MDEIMRAVRDCPSGALSYAIGGREAREYVDWDGAREPAIEITKDGPYRVTGGIGLTDPDGADVTRNEGASREHYALCRCGHSQNKPFCSGMHWYVDFRDPPPPARDPTLFEWAGGLPALTRMTRLLYEKLVPADPLLASLFATMPPGHPEQVARRLGEAFGGPDADPAEPGPAAAEQDDTEQGRKLRTMEAFGGQDLTEEQRARWVARASQAAREAGLPADPEFVSAFTGYIEWDSATALENSKAGAAPHADAGAQGDVVQPAHGPAPRWDWGPAGPPRPHGEAAAAAEKEEPVTLPGPGQPVSFAAHIKPLFRERDKQSMSFAFDLWSYDDVKAHAPEILTRLAGGSMPCDGAWPDEQVQVFRRWTEAGTQP